MINFIKSWPLSTLVFDILWQIQSIFAVYQNRIVVLRKSACVIHYKLAAFWHHFCLKVQSANYGLFRFGYMADHFFENEQWACYSKEDRQYLLLVNKIWTFRQQLAFRKSCTCHLEIDSFLILKAFSDETDGDINKYDFSILCNEMSTFWRSPYFSEAIFSKSLGIWYYRILHG